MGSIDLFNEDGSSVGSVLAQPKRTALLCYLALARPRGLHRRDTLLALFWPEADDAHARNSLRQSIFYLRRSLGKDVFETRGDDEIGLAPDEWIVDVDELEAALAAGDAGEALRRFTAPLMDGFHLSDAPAFDEWLDRERARLERRVWEAARKGADLAETAGSPDVAVHLARGAARIRPLCEPGIRDLIRLLGSSGDRPSALEVYDSFRERLKREFDAEPDDATQRVVAELREPSCDAPTDRAAPYAQGASAPDLEPTEPRRPRAWRALPGIGLVAAAAFLILPNLDTEGSAAGAVAREAIAVTTPDVFNADSSADFLALGIQEEIAATLRAAGLSVISTSAVRAAEAAGASSAALADGVGARYLVETSIQRAGTRYRVTLGLTDTRSLETVESVLFETAPLSLLDLRLEVARQVTARLASATPSVSLAYAGATQEAMQEYVTAVGLLGIEGGDRERALRWQEAEEHLTSALTIAPTFASAWARVAHLRFRMFWLGVDASADGIAIGEQALDSARKYDPTGLETRLAEAYHAYHIQRDWDRAVELAQALSVDLDEDVDVALAWAMSERRRGNFDEAARILAERLERHPSEITVYGGELINTYRRMEREADADAVLAQLVSVRGTCGLQYGEIRRASGYGRALDEHVRSCWPNGLSAPPAFWHEYGMRRAAAALAAVDAVAAQRDRDGLDPEWMSQQWAPFPLDFWRMAAHQLAGDDSLAATLAAPHIPELERLVDELPNDFLRRSFLVLAHTGAGNRAEALREAAEMVRVAEAGGDVWGAVPSAQERLMLTLMHFDDIDGALDILERLQTDFGEPRIGVEALATNPMYDDLRSSPRLAEIIAAAR